MNEGNLSGYRLSPQQEHLWLLGANDSRSPYRGECELTIEGHLDIEAWQSALATVINRHEILRTTFHQFDELELPVQVPKEDVIPRLEHHDLRDLTAAAQPDAVQKLLVELRRRPFDLANEPGAYFLLITLSSSRHLFIIELTALCIDSAGLINLAREIVGAYESPSSIDVLEEPLQYADVSEWLNELLESEDTGSGRNYWRKQQLSRPCPQLPSEGQGHTNHQFSPRTFCIPVDDAISARIDDDVFCKFFACWNTLLWRLTGEADVPVAALFDGRETPQLENTVGLLAKYLPVDVPLRSDSTFNEVLESVRCLKEERDEWQEFFDFKELDTTGISEIETRPFDYCFEYAAQATSWMTPDAVFTVQRHCSYFDRFKLNLRCIQNDDEILLEFHYDSSLFAAADIERLAAEFMVLLRNSLTNPRAAIHDLEILSSSERHQLLVDFNDTAGDPSPLVPIHQLIADQARHTPDNIAVTFAEKILTYEQLDSRANQLANFLIDRGLKIDDRVGLCLDRSLEMVTGMLGILKAGCAYVPLDPQSPPQRLSHMISEAGVSVLLTQEQWPAIDRYPTEPPAIDLGLDNLAYVLYTSGSTGRPKGVMVTHRALANHMKWFIQAFSLTESDRVLQKTSFGFDASVWEFYAPLLVGGTLVVARPGGDRDPDYIFRTVEEEAITILQVVPTFLRAMLRGNNQFEKLASLREVFVGGEALQPALQEEFFKHVKAGLHNLYGPTETCIQVTSWTCQRDDRRRTIPIGRPILEARTYVCDEKLRPLPIGTTGELLIGGICVARGYVQDPALTAEKFLPDPFSEKPGARLYRTGDYACYLTDGILEFLGRRDYQVKFKGFRIDMGEIESALREHEAINDAVVLIRQGRAADQQLVAYLLVPNQQSRFHQSKELYDHLAQRLPEYMIPSVFVSLDQFPLLPSGKIDRSALLAADGTRPERSQVHVDPRTENESELARIWREVLGRERIGIHDNFFDLGGDSILSIQIVARANQIGFQFTPRQLFQHQTIAALAAIGGAAGVVEAEQGEVVGEVPLTPIQKRFFEIQGNQPHFNQSVMLEPDRELRPRQVRMLTRALLQHHDALRARYFQRDDGWLQYNYPFDERMVDQVFTVLDLSNIPELQKRKTALSTAANQVQESLDLAEGPLIRIVLCDLGKESNQRLLIVIHHLVIDSVSWRILFEDMQQAMKQWERNETISLGNKTTSFQQWAKKLEAYAKSDQVTAELAYWEEDSEEAFASEAGADLLGSDEQVSVELDEANTSALLHDVTRVYGLQINEALLMGLSKVLKKWTGKDRVVIQMEGHGREQEIVTGVDLTRTVGWFTTVYSLVLDCSTATGGLPEQVEMIKKRVRGIPNQGIGFGLLKYLRGHQIATNWSSVINFNYLGQFNGALESGDVFSIAHEDRGRETALTAKREAGVEITAMIWGGRLTITWNYSPRLHRPETIEQVAQWYVESLQELVENAAQAESQIYTPSDFPIAELTEQNLEEILSVVKFGT